MNLDHSLEEVRENPSPPAMTQPFALDEESISQQVERFDASNYAEAFMQLRKDNESHLITPTVAFPTFIHTSEVQPEADHQMHSTDFWDPGHCMSAVTPPFTGGDGMGGPYVQHGDMTGSEPGEQMETLRDDQDHDQSPNRSMSSSSWSQQGHFSPSKARSKTEWNANAAAMQRTTSTPHLGTTDNAVTNKPLSLRTSSSTPKLLLTSKPSASWDLGRRSNSAGQADSPWGTLPGHSYHTSLGNLKQSGIQPVGMGNPTMGPAANFVYPQAADHHGTQGYPADPFRFTAPAFTVPPTEPPQVQGVAGYRPIPGPGLHQTLFNQGRRDSQPRLSLNIPAVGNTGIRSAGPILGHPTPVTASTNYGMLSDGSSNPGPLSAYPMMGGQAMYSQYGQVANPNAGPIFYGQNQFYPPESSVWMEPSTADTLSASASFASQELGSAFPITPAGTLATALTGLEVRSSRSSSVSAGGAFEKRHHQKPYSRQPSVSGSKFVTTQPINNNPEHPVLADSQVYKFGPGLVNEQRESGQGRARLAGRKSVGAAPKRKRADEDRDADADMDGCDDLADSVFDADFEVDIPTHGAQGVLLELGEREVICHEKLLLLAEHVKAASNNKQAELVKIKWTRAWLRVNYMPSPDCTVAKQGVYEGYEEACKGYGFLPTRKHILGTLLTRIFPKSNLRRLGSRRMSRYHYCGIQPVTSSQCRSLNYFSERYGNANGLIYQMPGSGVNAIEGHQMSTDDTSIIRPAEKTSRDQMADMSEGDLAQMAATNRVESLEGYPTINDFALHMAPEIAAVLWENVRMHLNMLMEAFENWDTTKVQHMILLFWGSLADELKEECRKEPVGDLINHCEALFWEEILGFLISYLAGPLSELVVHQVSELGTGLENLMDISTKGFDRNAFEPFVNNREKMAKTVGHLLVRYCDLRRTSDVLKDLFRRPNLFISVLSAWKSLGWSSILNQTRLILALDEGAIRDMALNPFEEILQQACDNQGQAQIDEISIEEMSNWVQDLICQLLEEGIQGKPVARNQIIFAVTWFTSEIARDLTIKSSDCFGIYQLFKVWVDDFVSLFLQRKICLRD